MPSRRALITYSQKYQPRKRIQKPTQNKANLCIYFFENDGSSAKIEIWTLNQRYLRTVIIILAPGGHSMVALAKDKKSLNFTSFDLFQQMFSLEKADVGEVSRLESQYRRDAPVDTIEQFSIFKAVIRGQEINILGVVWSNREFDIYEIKKGQNRFGHFIDRPHKIFTEHLPSAMNSNALAHDPDASIQSLFDSHLRLGLKMNLATLSVGQNGFQVSKRAQGMLDSSIQLRSAQLTAELGEPGLVILKTQKGWSEKSRLESNPYTLKMIGQSSKIEWSPLHDFFVIKTKMGVYIVRPQETDVRVYASTEQIQSPNSDAQLVDAKILEATNKLNRHKSTYVATVWSDGTVQMHGLELISGFGAHPFQAYSEHFEAASVMQLFAQLGEDKTAQYFFETYFQNIAEVLSPNQP